MMRIKNLAHVLSIVLISVFPGSAGALSSIPSNPSKLTYDSLRWNVPLGDPYRVVLKNGLRAYIAADSQLPLVQVSAFIRHGSLFDPRGKEGLNSLMTLLMRTGGTARYDADTLNALIDQYAMQFSLSAGEDALKLNAAFMSDYSDTGFAILEQLLFHPRFDGTKLDKEKKIRIEAIRHRFDNPAPTLDAAFQKMMYPGSPAADLSTEQSVGRIARADLAALHKSIFTTSNIILAVAGKFDRAAMIARLEKMFPPATKAKDSAFPAIAVAPAVRCLVVHKPISQMYVRFGAKLFRRPDADYYPVSVANLILGGGGFTSRLESKVRSDAGLTYSIYSSAESNYTYPGTWFVDFFTKSESFPLAMALARQVVDSLRIKGVTDTELTNAKANLIGEMPSMFRTRFDIVSTYAWNEYYGRSPNHYKEYPDSVKAITKEAIKKVMGKYLDSASFYYTIVGDTAALAKYHAVEGFALEKLLPRKTIGQAEIVNLK
jgi:zinc protease